MRRFPFERRIGELGHQLARWKMINEDAISAATGGKLAIACQRNGVNRMNGFGKWPPLHRHTGANFTFGPLLDPQFDQSKLFGFEFGGRDFVVFGRHERAFLVRGHLKQKAIVGFARNDRRAGLASFANGLGCFQYQLGFGGCLVVAGEAIGFEDGQNFAFEIDCGPSLDVANRDRLRCGGLRFFCGASKRRSAQRQKQTEKWGQTFHLCHFEAASAARMRTGILRSVLRVFLLNFSSASRVKS